MSNPKRSDYPLARMATAALFSFSFSANLGEAAPLPGVCSGVLTKLEDGFAIAEDPEHICIFSGEDERKIFAICAEGHRCEVEGILDDCKGTGECSELTNVASVRDLTLAQQQEQPPLPEMQPSSADDLRHREEVRTQKRAETRSCVRGAFESSLYAGLKTDRAMALAAQVCGGELEALSGEMEVSQAEAREFLKNILEAEAERAHDKLKAPK